MGDIFKDYDGKWAFIKTNNDRYVGRIINSISDDFVNLQPALSYFSDYVEDQNGNISRQLLITPIELCVGFDSKVMVKDVNLIMFFEDMSVEDRRQFEKAVRQGVDIVMQSRAAKAGITLETSMPTKESSGIIFK